MTSRTMVVAFLAVAALAAGGYGFYTLGTMHGMSMSMADGNATGSGAAAGTDSIEAGEAATRRHIETGLKAGDVDPVTGGKILHYHDPMVPGKTFDAPGRSPFMDMFLVPKYAGTGVDEGKVSISPRVRQNLGMRTAPVVTGSLSRGVTVPGSIAYNERDQVVVQARTTGFVERLHVRATLDAVREGQVLAEIYVPEWVAAQEEFLAVRRMKGTDLEVLIDGARQRMRLAGMSEAQVLEVESAGNLRPRALVTAPIGGVMTELSVREGMTVAAGATMFRINGIATVWANAEVPESQAALVRPGGRVEARAPALPDAVFHGRVGVLLPQVDPATRTIRARIELGNPAGRLAPGMFVNVAFVDPSIRETVLVPTEAVIQTGRRVVVMVAEADGTFLPVDVDIGMEANGQTEIKRGLRPGQRVVVSGQYLIDSEASLSGLQSRMQPDVTASAQTTHMGTATVESVDPDAVTLSHGPIPSLKWGDMTMSFRKPPGGAMPKLEAGDRVEFEFVMDREGPLLTAIRPASSGRAR